MSSKVLVPKMPHVVLMTNAKDAPFKCRNCRKIFISEPHLKRHVGRRHTIKIDPLPKYTSQFKVNPVQLVENRSVDPVLNAASRIESLLADLTFHPGELEYSLKENPTLKPKEANETCIQTLGTGTKGESVLIAPRMGSKRITEPTVAALDKETITIGEVTSKTLNSEKNAISESALGEKTSTIRESDLNVLSIEPIKIKESALETLDNEYKTNRELALNVEPKRSRGSIFEAYNEKTISFKEPGLKRLDVENSSIRESALDIKLNRFRRKIIEAFGDEANTFREPALKTLDEENNVMRETSSKVLMVEPYSGNRIREPFLKSFEDDVSVKIVPSFNKPDEEKVVDKEDIYAYDCIPRQIDDHTNADRSFDPNSAGDFIRTVDVKTWDNRGKVEDASSSSDLEDTREILKCLVTETDSSAEKQLSGGSSGITFAEVHPIPNRHLKRCTFADSELEHIQESAQSIQDRCRGRILQRFHNKLRSYGIDPCWDRLPDKVAANLGKLMASEREIILRENPGYLKMRKLIEKNADNRIELSLCNSSINVDY